MERIREVRRGGSTMTLDGISRGGPHHQLSQPLLPRRRPRTGGMRDSPEDDGGMEMAEPTNAKSISAPLSRLRDRGMLRKDHERELRVDRSTRSSKRGRGDRLLLHGGNKRKDDVNDTSDESTGNDDDEDEDDEEDEEDEEEERTTAAGYPPRQPSSTINSFTSSSSTTQNNSNQYHHQPPAQYYNNSNHHHLSPPAHQPQQHLLQRKGPFAKSLPVTWKAADEMIGVPVPRKARSGGGGGSSSGGEAAHMQRQASSWALTSRPVSPASTASPSYSNAARAIRKKLKPVIMGMKPPHPPPAQPQHQTAKMTRSPSFIQEEIEVAEVLFGLTRQFLSQPKQQQPESKDADASSESKSAPQLPSQAPDSSALPASISGPKRKRPANPAKTEAGEPKTRTDMQVDDPAAELQISTKDLQQSAGEFDRRARPEKRQELPNLAAKGAGPVVSDSIHVDAAARKIELASDGVREGKYCIDLMAPLPDRDSAVDLDVDEKALDSELLKGNSKKKEADKMASDELAPKKLILQLDLEKPGLAHEKEQSELQLPKACKSDVRPDRAVPSLIAPQMPMVAPQMPMAVGGWSGSFPPFSYFGQVPPFSASAVHSMDIKTGSSNSLPPAALLPPPPPRLKRCATHCYIAQQIQYHQRHTKMNPFLSSAFAAAAAPGPALLFGPRPPFNTDMVPSLDATLLGTAMQGNYPGKNPASLQHNEGPSMAAAPFSSSLAKEKVALSNNSIVAESSQRKAAIRQETPHSGPVPKMLGPAFIFQMNQQQAAGVAAVANQTGETKPVLGADNALLPSGALISSMASSGTTAMNLSFTGLQLAEAQFIAMLQNGAYQFPVAGQVGGALQYRNAVPFFNGPVYPSQMLHPPQQHGPQQQPSQKSGMSSTASSQKKQPQQQMQNVFGYGAATAAAANPHSFPSGTQRPTLLPNLSRQEMQQQFSTSSPMSAAASSNSGGYSERNTMPLSIANFPLAMMSFPPTVVPGGAVSVQSQFKASTPAKAAPASSNLIVMKSSNVHSQQGKTPLQALSVPGHEIQVSSSTNSSKPAPPVANNSGGASNLSRSSAATMVSGSPLNSVPKSTGGNPPASGNAKAGTPAVVLPSLQQPFSKNSSSSSKSSSMNHQNVPSIIGQQNISPRPNFSSKTQPPQQQQPQLQAPLSKHQSFPQALFFTSANYMQEMQSHLNAAAAYYQKQPSEKGQLLPHQHGSISVSTGMLSPSDPAKGMAATAAPAAANNIKVLHQPLSFVHAAHLVAAAQSASVAPHPHMPTSFSLVSTPPPAMPVKPTADQKPAAGK